MPITREQFESGDFKHRSNRDSDYVLEFLKKNRNLSYTPNEMSKALNKSSSMIRSHLRILIKKGIVERKVPQYILSKKMLKYLRNKSRR
jgi:predicted transcriptional regulator